jgi:hypothetical protein
VRGVIRLSRWIASSSSPTTSSSIASPKPQPDGRTELRLTPLELIQQLAALIPPPRLHRYHAVHRIHRSALEAHCPGTPGNPALARTSASWRSRRAPRALARAHTRIKSGAGSLGAAVGAHLRDLAPTLRALRGEMRLIALVTGAPALPSIVTHRGEPTRSGPGTWPPPLRDQTPEPLAHWADVPAPVPSVSSSTSPSSC